MIYLPDVNLWIAAVVNLGGTSLDATLKATERLAVLLSMTITVKNKTPLTVPDQVRRRAGFKPGDRVEFRVSRGVVTILPKQLTTTQGPDDTLTVEEAKKVRHALKQVREGKTTPWSQVKHELGL